MDDKRERKIRFLFEKTRREKERRQNGPTRRRVRGRETDWTVRGINCDDRQLNETFESRARVYGSASVSDSEKGVLELSPKFAIYDEVDELEIEVEVEKAHAQGPTKCGSTVVPLGCSLRILDAAKRGK